MTRGLRTPGVAWLVLCGVLAVGAVLVTAIGGSHPNVFPALEGRPGADLAQPWRLWTAAWVHWTAAHLAVNLAGVAVVAAVGWRAQAAASATLAWCLAWPLTQALLSTLDAAHLPVALRQDGGLSGVLHAGVVVLGLGLAWPERRRRAQPPPLPHETGFTASRSSALDPSRITEGPWAMTGLEELSPTTRAPLSTLDPGPPRVVAPAHPVRDRWIGALIVAGTAVKVLLESPWHLAARPSAALGIVVMPAMHAAGFAAGALAWALACLLPALARRGPAGR
ncbi:MAG: hypothetical protein ACTHL8_16475 [Burkholderiaceae bacterium]